jgi:hypothetical protein
VLGVKQEGRSLHSELELNLNLTVVYGHVKRSSPVRKEKSS